MRKHHERNVAGKARDQQQTESKSEATARVEYTQISPNAEVSPDEAQHFTSAFFTNTILFPRSANAQARSRRVLDTLMVTTALVVLRPEFAADPG